MSHELLAMYSSARMALHIVLTELLDQAHQAIGRTTSIFDACTVTRAFSTRWAAMSRIFLTIRRSCACAACWRRLLRIVGS